jgi:hypothetical protein
MRNLYVRVEILESTDRIAALMFLGLVISNVHVSLALNSGNKSPIHNIGVWCGHSKGTLAFRERVGRNYPREEVRKDIYTRTELH